MPGRFSLAHALGTGQRTLRYKSTEKILPPPSVTKRRAKMDDFYAARSRVTPPLPWSTFSPSFSLETARCKRSGRSNVSG